MKETRESLIEYWLGRSKESLKDAEILMMKGSLNSAINRFYYYAFYSAKALLFLSGFSAYRHAGIKHLFHEHFIKPGIFHKEAGELYDELFDKRSDADYGDFIEYTLDEINLYLKELQNLFP